MLSIDLLNNVEADIENLGNLTLMILKHYLYIILDHEQKINNALEVLQEIDNLYYTVI